MTVSYVSGPNMKNRQLIIFYSNDSGCAFFLFPLCPIWYVTTFVWLCVCRYCTCAVRMKYERFSWETNIERSDFSPLSRCLQPVTSSEVDLFCSVSLLPRFSIKAALSEVWMAEALYSISLRTLKINSRSRGSMNCRPCVLLLCSECNFRLQPQLNSFIVLL